MIKNIRKHTAGDACDKCRKTHTATEALELTVDDLIGVVNDLSREIGGVMRLKH
ncbi:MAG: hypothetical protein ACHP9Z_12275 [Streptosporangiales bacterium]